MLRNIPLQLGKKLHWDNHRNIPNSFRMLICGASGSGKSQLLFNLLVQPQFINYDNLVIYTTTVNQDYYQLLLHAFNNGLSKENIISIVQNQNQFKGLTIPTICKTFANVSNSPSNSITITLSDKLNDIPNPDDFQKGKRHLVCFDDCINLVNQTTMEMFWTKGRHNDISCIYLSQSYFDLSRMIRLNSNYLIIFRLSHRNLADVYKSAAVNIMDQKAFMQLAQNVFSKRYRYLAIDKENDRILTDIFEDLTTSESDDD